MNRKERRAQNSAAPGPASISSLNSIFELAVRRHQAGHPAEAERLYRQVLSIEPRHPQALHLLGVILLGSGRTAPAARLIALAIQADAGVAAFHCNLGQALTMLGRHDDAIAAYESAIRLRPGYDHAYCGLAEVLTEADRLDGAAGAYRRAIGIAPRNAAAHRNLGVVLRRSGRPAEAVAAYDAAIRLQPDDATTHFNRGNALADLGRHQAAAVAHGAAVRLEGGHADAWMNLGNALQQTGRHGEAIDAYRTVLALRPDHADAHANLGTALAAAGRPGAAIAAFEAALRVRPDFARASSSLGNVLMDVGHRDAATSAHRTAIRLDPVFAGGYSNLLMGLHYRAEVAPAAILAEARRFAAQFERTAPPAFPAHAPDPSRRLRIGYVSGDLGPHPVGTFLAPVLASHDRAVVETFCYSNHAHAGEMADRLRADAAHWREIGGLSDDAAATLVVADGIDILVDLSGHTARNRLTLFARRVAPVQASWLGYWGTSGLSRMDFILSDSLTIADGEESGYSEQVLRLPGSRFCYAPPGDMPRPALPEARTGVTFGSFNNLAKLSPESVQVWAELLRAVPAARLLLKWRSLEDGFMRGRVAKAFASAGIAPGRLELRGASPYHEMLAQYGDIDVALDPFPFSGGMTSCEALWMGVPVVTLPGAAAPSRQTTGFLQAIGATQWIASSAAEYVAIAAGLAADRAGRDRLRVDLRDRMAASPLCNGPAFARRLEGLYRIMWQRWCERAPAS